MKLFELKIEYHDTLNPKLWDGMTLKTEVQKKLLEIADTFMEHAGFDVEISDIVFIGSLTNYNWTPESDIDLHIIVNMDTFKKMCPALAGEDGFTLFKDKSTLFNEHHSIEIYGFPVEVVIEGEDDDKKQESATVYSVKHGKWLNKPIHSPPDTDTDAAQQQADKWKQEINKLIKTVSDPEDFDELKDDLSDERRSGIMKGGEFDEKNIAYKELRKSGHLNKLKQAKRDAESERLSLGENTEGKIWVRNSKGVVDVSRQPLGTLQGAPQKVQGDFVCYSCALTSLKGGPQYVSGEFRCHDNYLSTLDYAPEYVGRFFTCISNCITTLHNIHKTIKVLNGSFYFHGQKTGKIPSNILGLCLIKGIRVINSGDPTIDELFLKYRHDVNLFQDALIDAGFVDQAKL